MENAFTDGLRGQLTEGMPARVQGMAEAVILEWSEAVDAVPGLATVASHEIIDLLRLEPRDREAALRRRWVRSGERVRLPIRPSNPGGGFQRA